MWIVWTSQTSRSHTLESSSSETWSIINEFHSLSLQGVWVPFWTPKPLKNTPQDTQIFLRGIFKNVSLKHIIEFFHLYIIPMTLYKDKMTYLYEFIHVYGWNLNILWCPFKFWTPNNFTKANFGHPVSKSWLRPWWVINYLSDEHQCYKNTSIFKKTIFKSSLSKLSYKYFYEMPLYVTWIPAGYFLSSVYIMDITWNASGI